MFQTPNQESQLVYLRSKFIHKLHNSVRGGGGVCKILWARAITGGRGGLEMAKKRLRN